jgi:cyanophycin synthetase
MSIYIVILVIILLVVCLLYNNDDNEIKEHLLPTPKIMVEACDKNGIPYLIKDKKTIIIDDKIRFIGSVSNINSYRPRHIVMNKRECSALLEENHIPVPKFQAYPGLKSVEDVERIVRSLNISYPLVVKPACGQSGVHIYVGVSNEEDLRAILKKLFNLQHRKIKCDEMMIEEYVPGDNYRLLYYGDKLLDVVKREIPYVIGDGKTRLGELIEKWNAYRKEFELYPMQVDWKNLKKRGIDKNTVIQHGVKFTVKQICGCCVCNYVKYDPKKIHPSYLKEFKKVNDVTGLKFSGLDVIATDLSRPNNAKINEVNSAPSMRVHYFRDNGYLQRQRDLEIPIELMRLELE